MEIKRGCKAQRKEHEKNERRENRALPQEEVRKQGRQIRFFRKKLTWSPQ